MFTHSNDTTVQNGPLNPVRVQINSRIYARAVVGGILSHNFDRFSGSFLLKASANLVGGVWSKPTEIYIPPHLAHLQPDVTGAAQLKAVRTQPDGSRVVEVTPAVTGDNYEVRVGAVRLEEESDFPEYRGVSEDTMSKV